MNSRTRHHYLLLVAIVATFAGCSVTERHESKLTQTWQGDFRELEVEEVTGSVMVEAGAPGRIELVATVYSHRQPKQLKASDYYSVEVGGGKLSVERARQKKHRWFFGLGREGAEVHYHFRVPPTVALELRTVNGRISTRGIDGETRLVTVNGRIEAESTGNHELYARTVNGRVRAKFTRNFRGASFKTVNGGVEAILPPNASFAVDLSQVNGDFEASFPLSIHSRPGSRRVSGEVNGGRFELNIVTVNGDVELETLNGMRFREEDAAEPVAPEIPPVPEVPPVPEAPNAPPANPTT